MTNIPIEGGCLCGAIRYRATAQPERRSICHCRTCRLAAGASTVAWVVFPADTFEITRGTPNAYESSPGVTRTFCGRCGTSLTYQSSDARDTVDVTTASLDRADDFPPKVEIWTAQRLRWESLHPELPHYPGSSRGQD